MRRNAPALVLAAVLLLAAAGAALASGPTARARFTNYGFSVRYPDSLTRVKWCQEGMHVNPIALFTSATPPVCDAQATTVSWPPAQSLGANQMSIFLSVMAPPGVEHVHARWNARIGGRPALVAAPAYGHTYDTPVSCPAGRTREFRSAGILRPHSTQELIEVAATMCGPNLASEDAQFLQVLESLRFGR